MKAVLSAQGPDLGIKPDDPGRCLAELATPGADLVVTSLDQVDLAGLATRKTECLTHPAG